MSKKILLLSHCFSPFTYPETYLSAKRLGNIPNTEIDVITIHPLYKTVKTDKTFNQYVQDRFRQVHYITPPKWYTKMPFDFFENFFSLPDPYCYLNYMYFKHLNKLENYDCVITWSMFHSIHLLGLKIKKNYPKLPWIAHFSDPWTRNPFFCKNSFIMNVNKWLEKKVFFAANLLTFTSEETLKISCENYSNEIYLKSHVIPHNFDSALYPDKSKQSKDRFLIRYIGAFYGERKPDTFIEACRFLKKEQPDLMVNVFIEFIGSSQTTIHLSDTEKQYISFCDPVDYFTSLQKMKEADLLLVIDAPFEQSPFLPSKLVDYIGANKPIFGISPSGTSKTLIEEMGYFVAHPNNIDDIAKKLSEMLRKIRTNEIGAIPLDIFNRFSTETVTQKMTALLGIL